MLPSLFPVTGQVCWKAISDLSSVPAGPPGGRQSALKRLQFVERHADLHRGVHAGRSACPGFARSTRIRLVRLAVSTCGCTRTIWPRNT